MKKRVLLLAALLVLAPGWGVLLGQSEIQALRERAAHGETEALNELGTAHANGEGVPQDFAAALSYYQQAADRGLASAWFNLGMFHELGRGVPADLASAFKLYLKAAERGFAPAQFNVGNMYANGVGVKQDYLEAVLWFRQAAEQGVPEAQFNLGLAYELGRGVRKDEGLAQRWYRRAATQGNPRALYNLALMLEEGRGVLADPVAAMNFYRAAAAQNFAPAQNNLGILLAEGRGVPVNYVEAYTWLTVAAENGIASNVRNIVAQKLSPAALEEANAALAQLRPQFGLKEGPPARIAAAAPAAPAAGRDLVAAELMALKKRLAAADSELEKVRAENVRLAEIARATERSRGETERRLTAAESAARTAIVTASSEESARAILTTTSIDLEKLAVIDPRIRKLMAENARLNDDMKQAMLELAHLTAQLRITREKEGASAGATATERPPLPDGDKVAELTRKIEVLRSTVDKLAQESRWSARVIADLRGVRTENEQLRAERRRAH